jgi:uncharacterized protein (TIGR02677 family)
LLGHIESAGVERLLVVAARREAADAVPDLPENRAEDQDPAAAYEAVIARSLAAWRNRWRGLWDWFVSADSRHPSQARLLRGAAVTAITQLIDTVAAFNERRSGRSDRSADFRTLARWFAEAPDDAAAHTLWRAAFGLTPARHLTVTQDTIVAWEQEQPAPNTPWRSAPPVRISPQLRKTGSYERWPVPSMPRWTRLTTPIGRGNWCSSGCRPSTSCSPTRCPDTAIRSA